MIPPSIASDEVAEMIREDHLRLAVLLDTIEDELAEAKPVAQHIAQLRREYECHAIREEEAVAQLEPALVDSYRRGHERMRNLLGELSTAQAEGRDVGELLGRVVGMFTGHLMPAAAVFTAPPPSAAP